MSVAPSPAGLRPAASWSPAAAPPPVRERRSQPRGCLGTFLVLLAMIGVVGAGAVVAESVADLPSQPIAVVDGVSITPLGDWEFGGRSEDGRSVLLSKGAGSLAVSVDATADGPEAALRALLRTWAGESGSGVSTGDVVRWRDGFRASYTGTFVGIAYPVEGEVTALPSTTGTVLFDGWAGLGDYAVVRAEIDRMIAGTTR